MTERLRIVIDGELRELRAEEDTDGDGRLDTATVQVHGASFRLTDLDGDGLPDVARIVRADGSRALLLREPGTETFTTLTDSAAADHSIEESASHWFAQATTFTCGPAAITMVLADMFDVRISDEHAVWQRARELEAITADGMRAEDIARVIRSYGIPARSVRSSVDKLDRLLEEGHEAILLVDADDYWRGTDGRGAGDIYRRRPHAVRILGIDRDSGLAILSDSGRADPRFSRLPVPIEALDDAWADLDWRAVVTEISHAEVRAERERRARRSPRAVVRRAVVMPFTVRMRALLDALRRR